MALAFRLPKPQGHRSKGKTSSGREAHNPLEQVVDPEDLIIVESWIGDAVEIGRLVVGNSPARPAEIKRWEAFFATNRYNNPFTIIKACEYRGPIRGIVCFERSFGESFEPVITAQEIYITPPDVVGEERARMLYATQVCERLLGEMGLGLADLSIQPLPHDPNAPQSRQLTRP